MQLKHFRLLLSQYTSCVLSKNVTLSLTAFQSVPNPYLMGQRLDNVVAKKSVPHFPEEDEVETATSNIKT